MQKDSSEVFSLCSLSAPLLFLIHIVLNLSTKDFRLYCSCLSSVGLFFVSGWQKLAGISNLRDHPGITSCNSGLKITLNCVMMAIKLLILYASCFVKLFTNISVLKLTSGGWGGGCSSSSAQIINLIFENCFFKWTSVTSVCSPHKYIPVCPESLLKNNSGPDNLTLYLLQALMTFSSTKPALILLLLVIFEFCSMAIAGETLCPSQIKPAWVFLGCARGTLHEPLSVNGNWLW